MQKSTKTTKSYRCPECGDPIAFNATNCDCGWQLQNTSKQKMTVKQDTQCGYMHEGERCPIPGGAALSTNPQAKLYCTGYLGKRGHLQSLYDPLEAFEILRFNQENRAAIMEEYYLMRRNWRDILTERSLEKIINPLDYKAEILRWLEQWKKSKGILVKNNNRNKSDLLNNSKEKSS